MNARLVAFIILVLSISGPTINGISDKKEDHDAD